MRTTSCLALLLAAGAVAGCTGSNDDADDEHDPRFVGRWFLEETEAHALYGASTYAFGADGAVALIWDAGIEEVPLGHVLSPDATVTCTFADTWRSNGTDRLVIGVACSDTALRELVLRFSSSPATNATGADVAIVSVDDESGWRPPQWGWSFRKCDGGDDCIP